MNASQPAAPHSPVPDGHLARDRRIWFLQGFALSVCYVAVAAAAYFQDGGVFSFASSLAFVVLLSLASVPAWRKEGHSAETAAVVLRPVRLSSVCTPLCCTLILFGIALYCHSHGFGDTRDLAGLAGVIVLMFAFDRALRFHRGLPLPTGGWPNDQPSDRKLSVWKLPVGQALGIPGFENDFPDPGGPRVSAASL